MSAQAPGILDLFALDDRGYDDGHKRTFFFPHNFHAECINHTVYESPDPPGLLHIFVSTGISSCSFFHLSRISMPFQGLLFAYLV